MNHADVVRRPASVPASRRSRRGLRPRLDALETRAVPALVVPALSSLPGAAHTIYLDFDGHVTTGTSWNSYDFDSDGNISEHSTINSPAYNTDGDAANFGSTELAAIEDAWRRISEDYYPFNVNVTTVDPGIEGLRKSGSGDSQWGIRVVVTADTEGSGAGGIAYIDSFNWSSDTPAFVYTTGGKNIAEAASHEAGHSLGLSHDGLTSGASYYQGHGTGETGWAPIMGVGYYKNVSTWDRGEYYLSNNAGTSANYGKGPDDVAVITTYNGFGFRPDDYGDTIGTAGSLGASGTSLSGAGFIRNRTDADYLAFNAGAGALSLTVAPYAYGPNLDVRADLYDASGTLVATADPATTLGATLNATVAAGLYYLKIDGVGWGTPGANPPTGYTDYGSLGRYTVTGTRVDPGGLPTLSVSDATVSETAGTATFTVTLAGTVSGTVSVSYGTSDGSATAGLDYQAVSGALTFTAAGTQTVTVPIFDDALLESNETFTLGLSSPSGAMLADAAGVGTIISDEVARTISIAAVDASKPEGTGSSATPFVLRISRTGSTAGAASVSYALSGLGGKSWASGSDFSGGAFPSGTATIPDGATSVDVVVSVVADSTKENNESFRASISGAPGGYVLGTASADAVIVNDDAGKPGRGANAKGGASALTHDEQEAAGLIPCAYPRPDDVDRWLEEHDHDDEDHGHGHGYGREARADGDGTPGASGDYVALPPQARSAFESLIPILDAAKSKRAKALGRV